MGALLLDGVAAGTLPVSIGRVFSIDQIAEAHRVMQANEARGKIVVLTR
ncbi:zinc-binding dehydrogenase [Acidovorax sp. Root217]|nr:zinc-binding dehydrogenase [Acidovorax sp. Root217]